jgi:hypothetical protein
MLSFSYDSTNTLKVIRNIFSSIFQFATRKFVSLGLVGVLSTPLLMSCTLGDRNAQDLKTAEKQASPQEYLSRIYSYLERNQGSNPQSYPAQSYTTTQLLQRLFEIGQSENPSQAAIETEFGIRFIPSLDRDGRISISRGRPPLGDAMVSITYFGQPPGSNIVQSLYFSLLNYDLSKGTSSRREKQCISEQDFDTAMYTPWLKLRHRMPHGIEGMSYYDLETTSAKRRIRPDFSLLPGDPGLVRCSKSITIYFDR